MTATKDAFGVSDQLGVGGSLLSPKGGSAPSGHPKDLQALLRLAFSNHYAPYADVAGLTASKAKNRADGQIAIKLDDYSLWVWEAASATAADGTHIAPTDVGVGVGRWVKFATASGADTGEVQHVTIDIPLATINAKADVTPFNIGAALPANARLLRSELNVIQVVGGGTISACTAKVQGGADADGTILGGAGGSDVHAAVAVFTDIKTGSNPYIARGGQQLKMTLDVTGDTLANATTGHLSVDVYYTVEP